MEERNSRDLLVNVALALFAGALGSLLTLLLTSNLTPPTNQDSGSPVALVPVESEPITNQPVLDTLVDQSLNDEAYSTELQRDLREALDEAAEERAQLAQTLVQLTRQIEILESDAINREGREALQSADTAQSTPENSTAAANAGGAERSEAQERIDSLIAAGIDAQQAQEIQARQDQYQLARLELIDQAERENWRDTDEFAQRSSELDAQRPDLRSELGDENYDRYLFESGRNNRVVVSAIIPGSVAETVGLQTGDMVISYANERIFSRRELQQATREGLRGESVALTVQRQGQTLFFDVPRGPLGVSMSAEQQSPS